MIHAKDFYRFCSKFTVNEDGCWIWTASKNKQGYGKYRYKDKMLRAHRYAYEIFRDKVPPGFDLAHYRMDEGPEHAPCSRACVNPAHLRPMPHKENIRRGRSGAIRGGQQLAKTHCPQGHIYAGSNLYINPDGRRLCRACNRENQRKLRAIETE